MKKTKNHSKISNWLFYIAIALVVYMPLHVFIAQSASLLTGGIEVWKAAKDILIVSLVPILLWLSYVRGLFANKYFRWFIIAGGAYTFLHLSFVALNGSDDTYSAIVGSVYNTRLLGYLLLGYLVGSAKNGEKHLKYLLTAAVLVAAVVALFGVFQYFLPSDLLTHVGYSTERGVKYMFFIDDKPDFPRVMSTLKDPNSLGAYLILPILLTGFAVAKETANKLFFVRPLRRAVLGVMLAIMLVCLFLTFSRGALIALFLSVVALLCIVTGEKAVGYLKKFWWLLLLIFVVLVGFGYIMRDSYVVQNVIFHADESTIEADPNEKRVTLLQEAVDDVIDEPVGHSPGSAGLVSINNPKGGLLTENYYVQIAYEVGWLGAILFVAILSIVTGWLWRLSRKGGYVAAVLLASLFGLAFYALLIHLWSNEAVALQWWLLAGTTLGLGAYQVAPRKR